MLKKNWLLLTGKGSNHINVYYLFVVDKIKKKEVKLVFCPTKKILANYQSKQVHGRLFYDHRNTILGIQPKGFDCHKRMYIKVLQLKQYELYDNEEDLFDI